jgi:hypothetical protein
VSDDVGRGRRRRGHILVASLGVTFAVIRGWLAITPNADFNVAGYNIHHLFTGLLLLTFFGVPLALGFGHGRRGDWLTAGFGVGLALALDEWVYLIATDGSNASYLLPVSFWGGLVFIVGAALYVMALLWLQRRRERR